MAPIPGDAPPGANVRYEPEFEQLETEIAKLESVDQLDVDWRKVAELSRAILAEKGKDLLVAAYYAAAEYQQKGYAGLLEGLTVCDDMCRTFWEDLQPKKKRARARGTAVQWVADRVGPEVEKASPPGPSDKEALEGCVEKLRAFQEYLDEQLGDDAPALGSLRRELDDRAKSIAEPDPEPAPAPGESASAPAASAPAAPAPPPPPSAPAAPAAGADVSGVYKTLDGVWDTLLSCADLIFQADLANPDAYTLRRVATWHKSKLSDVAPPQDGKLSFPGNVPGLTETLDQLLEGGEHEEVIRRAEPETSERPFWIDPHYYVFRALDESGKRYKQAALAVQGQVAAFVARNQQVLDLSFSNDAPLASGPARLWLSQAQGGGGGAGGNGAGPASIEQVIEGALGEARQLLLSGEFAGAVESVSQALEGAHRGRRGDFVSRLALARLCLEGGKPAMALAQLNRLQQDCDRFALEEWEPDLAVQLLELRWRSIKSHPTDQESADELYERLCGLDLAAALALTNQ